MTREDRQRIRSLADMISEASMKGLNHNFITESLIHTIISFQEVSYEQGRLDGKKELYKEYLDKQPIEG